MPGSSTPDAARIAPAAASGRPSRSAAIRQSPIGRYLRAWRLLPSQLAYLIPTALLALVVVTVVSSLPASGGLLSVLVVLLLAALLLASRLLGRWELVRLHLATTPPISPPTRWQPLRTGRPLESLSRIIGDGHYWLYGLHAAIAGPFLAAVTTTAWASAALGAALLLAFPLWNRVVGVQVATLPAPFVRAVDPGAVDGRDVATLAAELLWHDPAATGAVIALAVAAGAILLLALPVVARVAVLAHWGLARLLLARSTADELRQEVRRADAARAAALRAEDVALRRLERDIHDGPQQRLLRLRMELGTAERRLTTQPEAAAEAIALSRRLASETIEELRALGRGLAPPILQDRGLIAALETLGTRSDGRVAVAVAIRGPVPDALQRSAYFIAAELVANAMKHTASAVVVTASDSAGSLRIEVRDDGPGGARVDAGRGLAGVVERLEGLSGILVVDSPKGGPTLITAEVPVR